MNIKVESIGNRVRITNDHEAFTPLPTDITTKSSGNFVSIRIKGDEPVEIDINVLLDKVTVGSTVYNPNTTSAADIEAAIIPLFPKANTGSGGTGTTTAASIALPTITPVNSVLANGDTLDVAANKLQGQVNAAASNLVPTAIKTSAYTAAANEFVKTDASSGNVPVTLPAAPADKTRIAVKMIAVSGSNTTTIAAGGSAVFNKAGGSTSISFSLLNQSLVFQYESATGIWNVTSGDIPLSQLDARFATVAQQNTNTTNIASNTSAITNLRLKKDFGLLIPQFKTVNKFDNISGTLSATQLAIHSSGTGLISATGGTNADGYLKLPAEVEARSATRTDWRIAWDTTESTASMTLGIGDAATGYMITIANTGGNVVVTFPSGATVTGALTGTVNLSVSMATGNMGVTCSVHVLGTPAALTSSNPYRVPVWEYAKATKTRLWHAYFKTNTTSSKIVGFLHNMKNWNGDPTGQLLTRTMLINPAGQPGAGGGSNSFINEHDNMIIIPERASLTTPLKVCNYFHGRTLTYKSIIDVAIADNGESGRQLLAAGYAIIATSGGVNNSNIETDYWGNPTGVSRAAEVFDVLQNNITNTGKEYLYGWSMGGVGAANYLRQNFERVGAVWLSCPVLDLEESGSALAVQTQSALKQSLDNAYTIWYYSLVATNTADPQTDNGTNWRQVSDPGGLPTLGMRNYTGSTVSSAQTAQYVIPLASGARFNPDDYVFFKWSGQLRQIAYMSTGVPNSLNLDAPVTVAASEPVSIIRTGSKYGYDFTWMNRPAIEWSAGTSNQNVYVRRKSLHPELDIIPHNPKRFADFYAEMAVPFHIMVGGDGTSTGNDGILNNAPMFAFASAVNAITANVVTMIAGSGTHIAPGNISYTDILTLFNAN